MRFGIKNTSTFFPVWAASASIDALSLVTTSRSARWSKAR